MSSCLTVSSLRMNIFLSTLLNLTAVLYLARISNKSNSTEEGAFAKSGSDEICGTHLKHVGNFTLILTFDV